MLTLALLPAAMLARPVRLIHAAVACIDRESNLIVPHVCSLCLVQARQGPTEPWVAALLEPRTCTYYVRAAIAVNLLQLTAIAVVAEAVLLSAWQFLILWVRVHSSCYERFYYQLFTGPAGRMHRSPYSTWLVGSIVALGGWQSVGLLSGFLDQCLPDSDQDC